MLTIQQRQYQLEHQHVFTATVKRTGATFKFGFVNDNLKDTQATEYIHGFWGGHTSRTIETIEDVDINDQDTIKVDNFGWAKVGSTKMLLLNSRELRFVSKDRATKITQITLNATGSK